MVGINNVIIIITIIITIIIIIITIIIDLTLVYSESSPATGSGARRQNQKHCNINCCDDDHIHH